jgi:hypothetical protein
MAGGIQKKINKLINTTNLPIPLNNRKCYIGQSRLPFSAPVHGHSHQLTMDPFLSTNPVELFLNLKKYPKPLNISVLRAVFFKGQPVDWAQKIYITFYLGGLAAFAFLWQFKPDTRYNN